MDMAHKHEKEEEQQKTSDDLQPVPMLPPEIIVEILLRLAVESLLRCRSVCKLWCSIVSDPRFVKSHLSLSTSNNRYSHHRLIFSAPAKSTIPFKSCLLYDALFDGSVNALELDYPLKDPHHDSVRIYGSCNGLLCISTWQDSVVIWNPSTRRLNKIPSCSADPYVWDYGFGYDESTDDYKVVGISSVLRDGFSRYDMLVKIYSLKNGNWKVIDDFHNGCRILEFSVKFLNGAFHWVATRDFGSYRSWMIVSLDLAKERYGEISRPVYDEGVRNINLELGVLGEWLCVLYKNRAADIWVMKVYGDKDSWTKLVSIPYTLDLGRLAPLFISKDGKVLLQLGSKLIVYDSKNLSPLKILNYFSEYIYADTFVGSLVSPVGDNNEAA